MMYILFLIVLYLTIGSIISGAFSALMSDDSLSFLICLIWPLMIPISICVLTYDKSRNFFQRYL